MKDQLKTIRDALEAVLCDPEGKCCIAGSDADRAEVDKALTALSELERMAVDQEPILIVQHGEICYKSQDDDQSYGMWCPVTPDAEHGLRNGTQLYTTPPAQQPQHDHVAVTWDAARTRILAVTLQDAEGRVLCVIDEAPAQQPQARPDFTDEWTGYLKDGETPFERFLRERKDLTALTKLYQRALEENESLKAQQPQAEAVPSDVVRDAERWRMLPAYFYEYQIDAMKLYRDIDAAIAQQKGGV